ncbi:MAG: hypothetical protein ACK55I_01385, partial [bacterium]
MVRPPVPKRICATSLGERVMPCQLVMVRVPVQVMAELLAKESVRSPVEKLPRSMVELALRVSVPSVSE